MKYASLIFIALIAVACSSTTCTLQMDPNMDLSNLTPDARCWLAKFENVCISLAGNKDFADKKQLKEDLVQGADLLMQLGTSQGWYGELDAAQRSHLHDLMLAVAVHYGVKHFLHL